MQEFNDFLNFKTFVSPYMLFTFYYLGAIVAPITAYIFAKKIYKYPKEIISKTMTSQYKVKIIILSITMIMTYHKFKICKNLRSKKSEFYYRYNI